MATPKKKPEDLLKRGAKPLIGTKYTIDEVCAKIGSIMVDGASITEVIAALDIARGTFYNWLDQYPEILDALKIAEEKSRCWWEKNGRINLYTQGFNSALWYMNMKNRFKWTDRQEVEASGKDGAPIKHEVEAKVSIDVIDDRITSMLNTASAYSCYATPGEGTA